MSRVEVPTWQCDRCEYTTQEQAVIDTLNTVQVNNSDLLRWDLCPTCYEGFTVFMDNQAVATVAVGGPIAVAEPIDLGEVTAE